MPRRAIVPCLSATPRSPAARSIAVLRRPGSVAPVARRRRPGGRTGACNISGTQAPAMQRRRDGPDALAMLKAEVPPNDPALVGLRRRRSGAVHQRRATAPERTGRPRRSTRRRASPWPWRTSTPSAYETEIEAVARTFGKPEGQRLVGLPHRTQRRHVDLAVRRPRPLGGRERRASRSRRGLGPRGRSGSSRSRAPAGSWSYHRDEAEQPRRSR